LPSYSITGTVSYAGTKTGRTYIRVFSSNGCQNGCGGAAGTSLPSAPSSSGTSYTVKGLQPGNYVAVVEIDSLNNGIGNGVPNASNPSGSSATFTIVASNASLPNIPLTETTPAPVAPSGLAIAPGSTFALVQYNQNNSNGLRDNNGREIDTSYRVYWGTDVNATNGTGSPATFAAHGTNDRNYIVRNLAPGTYFFKMTGLVGSTESAPSPIVSAVLAAGTGAFTVSGKVTFTLPTGVTAATGPLYVGLFNNTKIYGQEIKTPFTSPVSYSLTGVPAGNYQAFAIIDLNDNGLIEPTDISNVSNQGGPPPLTVSGTMTNDITLTTAVSTMNVTTYHQQNMSNTPTDNYGLNFGISWGSKRPVAMTLISGPNVAVPWDLTVDNSNGGGTGFPINVTPLTGDTYQFLVTFSDGSTQTMPASITVLNSFVTGMLMNSPVAGTATVPVLNWVTPASTPSPYTYFVGLYNITNGPAVNVNWSDYGGHNSNGIPSGTTNIPFNQDGSATNNGSSISSLPTGTHYNWFVGVQDANGNSSSETVEYDIP
jgi:hypothetical protein